MLINMVHANCRAGRLAYMLNRLRVIGLLMIGLHVIGMIVVMLPGGRWVN